MLSFQNSDDYQTQPIDLTGSRIVITTPKNLPVGMAWKSRVFGQPASRSFRIVWLTFELGSEARDYQHES